MPGIHDVLDGRYEILREIGTGGAGIVFLGYHLTLNKYVVVKKLKTQVREYLNIRGEADILKGLHHRYLPQVYDFLIVGDEVYTVMDYVDGHDLNWYIRNGVVFSEAELAHMLLQLCEVLEYLHGQKPPVIHRDIKPGNIMIRENGDVCLIDFNISFAGLGEEAVGYSCYYAPPEQIEMVRRVMRGEEVRIVPDGRGDIYSLGATFYYLMTGEHAAAGSRRKTGVKMAYSSGLFGIIRKAMAASPGKRYQSAARMRKTLVRRMSRKGRLLPAMAVCGAVFVLTLGVMALLFHAREQKEAAFAAAYGAYVGELSTGEPSDWIQDGISILNEKEFAGQLERKPRQKAVVLESIADGYYEEEHYAEAAGYYREALSLREEPAERSEDARDLILSLIRSGNTEAARRELAVFQAEISSDTLACVEVEFLLQEGKREEALEAIDRLLSSSQDREILLRCSLYGAECLSGQEEYERRLSYLSLARQYAQGPLTFRKIGDACLEIVKEKPEDSVFQEALEKAEECYEKVCGTGGAGYVDRLNLAVIFELQGSYREALKELTALMEEEPEDYRAYREAAFTCYQIELSKAARNRNMYSVIRYGEQALDRYDEAAGDEQMIQLKELLNQLSE